MVIADIVLHYMNTHIYFSTDGHLDYLQFSAIMNNDHNCMNLFVDSYVFICIERKLEVELLIIGQGTVSL